MTRPHHRSRSHIAIRIEQGTQDWTAEAACAAYVARGDDPWWSDRDTERARAEMICREECPVLAICASVSADEPWGVWAGKSRGWAGRPRSAS